jgi:hypothetical protein
MLTTEEIQIIMRSMKRFVKESPAEHEADRRGEGFLQDVP